MNRQKKLTIISTVWNVILFFLLFFQSSLIYAVVKKNLFPTFGFLKPVLDGGFVEFMRNRAVIATVTIAAIILIEIILFFVVNIILQKKYNEYSDELKSKDEIIIQFKKSNQYYKFINIYLSIFIVIFLFSTSYYAFSLVSISKEIDLSMNNNTINSVHNIAMETDINNLEDIKGFIDGSIEKIKSDSEIYSFVDEILNCADVIHYINMLFYTISYLVLTFGIYRNIRLYFSLRKKEVSYE